MASGERNYWRGGGATGLPTDWGQDDNWSILVPVDGEDVVVPARARWPILQNVDRTGDNTNAGLDLGSFTVERGFEFDLGQPGAPMMFSVSAGIVLHQGDGTFHYVPETGSAGSDDTNQIIIDSPNHVLAAVIHVPDGIAVNSVQCLSGHTELSTDAAGAATGRVSNLMVGQRGAGSQGPTVETSGDSFIDTVSVAGGDVVLGHTETQYIYVSGGTVSVTQDDLSLIGLSIRLYQMGGRVDWFGGIASSVTVVDFHVMGGVLNLNASSADKTITALVIHPGATVLHNRQWVTVVAYRDFGLDLFRSPDVSGTINTWLSVDTDWENVNNWDQGHIPVDDEHVIIPGDATKSLLLNMDQTGLGAEGLRLASLTIHDDCTVDVGASGEPLKCTISGRLIYRGRGTLYFTAKKGSGAISTAEIIIDSPNSNDAAVIVVPDSNSLKWLEVLRGRITLSAGSTSGVIADMHVAGTGHVTVAADSLVQRTAVSGGTVLHGGDLDRVWCSGGLLRITADDPDGVIAIVYMVTAGIGEVRVEGVLTDGAASQLLWAMGGTTDFNRTAASKSIDRLYHFPRAKVRANRPWITFDNTYDFGLERRSGS